jgi:XTP/dITP diphosphohydrolase
MLGDGLLLLATRSAGKLRELRPFFAHAGFDAIDLCAAGIAEDPREEMIEAFETFEENALAKARFFANRCGLPTVADDSGLEVMALAGRPGVRSKRYSGRTDLSGQALDDANNALLIAQLAGVDDRRARYICAAAFVMPGGAEIVKRGETAGEMLTAPRGQAGFGYDPYFRSAEVGRTFGELSIVEKEAISHRGRAFRALVAAVAAVDRGVCGR